MKIEIDVHLNYRVPAPCWVLVQLEAAQLGRQQVVHHSLAVQDHPMVARVAAGDGVGSRFWIQVQNAFVCNYHAELLINRANDDMAAKTATPLEHLPAEAVKYLFPSRYCPIDEFDSFISGQFGSLAGGARIDAMAGWLHQNLAYDNQSSDGSTTALQTFEQRRGVCRDYTHLLISLARASAIPARYASVYSPDVTPMDFHAMPQVYLDGDWHLVDPTGMSSPDCTAVIGVGRDATDVSFLTSYGELQFLEQSVRVQVVD